MTVALIMDDSVQVSECVENVSVVLGGREGGARRDPPLYKHGSL